MNIIIMVAELACCFWLAYFLHIKFYIVIFRVNIKVGFGQTEQYSSKSLLNNCW